MASKRSADEAVGAIGGGTATKKTTKRKKIVKTSSFTEYLNSDSLVSDFLLTKNGNLSFHWANWNETCKYQKEYLDKDISNEIKLKNLNDELSELKKTDVWLKNKRGCMKMNLYDVYEGYLDNRLRMTWFERDGILMSFENEAGPYNSLANMRWFNNKIYAAFMFRKLLTQPVPQRGFRVGLSAPILCKFDNSPLNTAEFTLHQASEYGVILKVNGKNNLSKIKHSEVIHLELDITPFLEAQGEEYEDIVKTFEKHDFVLGQGKNRHNFTLDSNIMEKFNNDRNAVSGGEEKFYFFVPYTEMFKGKEHKAIEGVFSEFVGKVKEGLTVELKKAA